MGPEWCRLVTGDFKEESWGDRVYRLDEVFAEEESACAEVRAGAYPFARIWLVFGVEWHGDRCFCTPFPFVLEQFTPGREISISSDISKNLI